MYNVRVYVFVRFYMSFFSVFRIPYFRCIYSLDGFIEENKTAFVMLTNVVGNVTKSDKAKEF